MTASNPFPDPKNAAKNASAAETNLATGTNTKPTATTVRMTAVSTAKKIAMSALTGSRKTDPPPSSTDS